jgi:predicted transcriptional regulator
MAGGLGDAERKTNRGGARQRGGSHFSGAKRRSKPEIYFTIVSALSEEPTTLLRLSAEAGMSFEKAKESVGYLVSKGLVTWAFIDDKTCYTPTQRGREFASSIKKALEFIE